MLRCAGYASASPRPAPGGEKGVQLGAEVAELGGAVLAEASGEESEADLESAALGLGISPGGGGNAAGGPQQGSEVVEEEAMGGTDAVIGVVGGLKKKNAGRGGLGFEQIEGGVKGGGDAGAGGRAALTGGGDPLPEAPGSDVVGGEETGGGRLGSGGGRSQGGAGAHGSGGGGLRTSGTRQPHTQVLRQVLRTLVVISPLQHTVWRYMRVWVEGMAKATREGEEPGPPRLCVPVTTRPRDGWGAVVPRAVARAPKLSSGAPQLIPSAYRSG